MMLPHQVLFAMLLETSLILLTLICLSQPNIFLPFKSPRVRAVIRAGGFFMLCLTFCWSVVLGCVLTLNQMTFRI